MLFGLPAKQSILNLRDVIIYFIDKVHFLPDNRSYFIMGIVLFLSFGASCKIAEAAGFSG